jgi:predicted nucleic acid-binding protein
MPLALVDANIPIYAAGSGHPLKGPCADVLRLISEIPTSFLTDAEVLQELLHYYLVRRLVSHGLDVVEAFAQLMSGRVEPVLGGDVLDACRMAREGATDIPARDLLHVAVARRVGVAYVVSADSHFDQLAGVTRLDPARLSEWRLLFTE